MAASYSPDDLLSKNRKRGSSRYDRMPLALADEVRIDCAADFLQLVPYELQEPFTVCTRLCPAAERQTKGSDAPETA